MAPTEGRGICPAPRTRCASNACAAETGSGTEAFGTNVSDNRRPSQVLEVASSGSGSGLSTDVSDMRRGKIRKREGHISDNV